MSNDVPGLRKKPDNSRPLSYVLLKKYGLRQACAVIWNDVLYDFRHGVDTFRPVSNKSLFSADKQVEQNRYVPSTFELMDSVYQHICQWVSPENCHFLDIGSGKAKALIAMSEKPFTGLTGVEVSKELHEVAKNNLKKLKLEDRVQLHNADASSYCPTSLDRVVYFFNPFTGTVLHQCLKRICDAPGDGPKYIIYVNPTESDVFEAYFDLLDRCVFQPGSVEVNFYKTRR